MSTTVFPTLVSSNWKLTRTPQWTTTVKSAVSGDRRRAALRDKPLWKWTLKNGVLQSDPAIGDLQAIEGLFNDMCGRWDFFLWKDPEDDSIADADAQINILGTLYWPVAFLTDSANFDRFAYQLWQCGSLEFEQVGLSTLALAALQQPHGRIVGATLNVTWAYNAGGGSTGGGSTAPSIQSTLGGIADVFSGSWTTRTDSLVIAVPGSGSLSSQSWAISFSSPDNGTIDPPFLLTVYEVSASVDYEDGTLGTLIPKVRAVQGNDSTYGVVSNPQLSVDSNAATGATITGSQVFPLRSNGALIYTF